MRGHHNMEINIFAELFMPTELFIWLQLHIKNQLQSLSPAEAFVDKLNRLNWHLNSVMLLYKIYTFVPKFPVFSNLYTDHLRTFL